MAKILTPARIEKMAIGGVGFKLLFAAERVDNAILTSLFNLAREAGALEKMAAMQRGEAINQIEGFESENRSVLARSAPRSAT